jgi:phosphoribosylglycinamide formyltransferase-1
VLISVIFANKTTGGFFRTRLTGSNFLYHYTSAFTDMAAKEFTVAIFASGTGTNALNIIRYFSAKYTHVRFVVLSNRANAPVLARASAMSIPAFTFSHSDFYNYGHVQKLLNEWHVKFVVLAGFLWLVPPQIISLYAPNRMVNIHPALLPKFGGKGMYGMHVHKAVLEAAEKHSGITIHYVNENYDEGQVIFQTSCEVEATDTPESLAQKIHALEYEHYPRVLEQLWLKLPQFKA